MYQNEPEIDIVPGTPMRRGANVPLAPSRVVVGIEWQTPNTGAVPYDLDVSAFLVGRNGKVECDENFVFYNNRRSPCGGVKLSKDNRDGENDGAAYDETLKLDFSKIPSAVDKVVIVLSIHQGVLHGQRFGDLDNAFLALIDPSNITPQRIQELCRFNIAAGDLDDETAMIFGEFYRKDGGWKFRAVGQGRKDGYAVLVNQEFGLELEPDSQPSQVGPTPPSPLAVPPMGLHLPGGPAGVAGPVAPTNPAFPEPVQLAGLTQSFGIQPAPAVQTPTQPGFVPVLQVPGQQPINYMQAVDPSLLRRGTFDIGDSIVPMPTGPTMEFSFNWRKAAKDFGLIALVTYRDGRKVAYDWSHLGSASEEVWHHGDNPGHEYITVQLHNGSQIDSIALVGYSEVNNGLGSFKGSGCYCTINNGLGDVAHFKLKKRNPFVFHAVFGVVVLGAPGQMFLRRDARYSQFGSEKRPVLEPGGRIIMNAGPVKFKRGYSGYNWY